MIKSILDGSSSTLTSLSFHLSSTMTHLLAIYFAFPQFAANLLYLGITTYDLEWFSMTNIRFTEQIKACRQLKVFRINILAKDTLGATKFFEPLLQEEVPVAGSIGYQHRKRSSGVKLERLEFEGSTACDPDFIIEVLKLKGIGNLKQIHFVNPGVAIGSSAAQSKMVREMNRLRIKPSWL